jgi:heme iron utilization protein
MSMKETAVLRQHRYTGPALPQLPEPSHAERIRTLVPVVSIGTLYTISRKRWNVPFGSLMPSSSIRLAGPPSSLAIWPRRPRA